MTYLEKGYHIPPAALALDQLNNQSIKPTARLDGTQKFRLKYNNLFCNDSTQAVANKHNRSRFLLVNELVNATMRGAPSLPFLSVVHQSIQRGASMICFEGLAER